MILDIIVLLFLGCIAAFVSYFLDFCLGHPGKEDEVNTKAIFFNYTLYLAKRRLKNTDCKTLNAGDYIRQNIVTGFANELKSPDCVIRSMAKQQLNNDIVMKGRNLFTYEYSLGMCIFCTNFWISLLLINLPAYLFHFINLTALPNFSILLIPVFISHFILRKI